MEWILHIIHDAVNVRYLRRQPVLRVEEKQFRKVSQGQNPATVSPAVGGRAHPSLIAILLVG